MKKWGVRGLFKTTPWWTDRPIPYPVDRLVHAHHTNSLGHDWNLANKHILYMMSGLLAVKYSKEPIMPLYIVESMDLPFSSYQAWWMSSLDSSLFWLLPCWTFWEDLLYILLDWWRFLPLVAWFEVQGRSWVIPSCSFQTHYACT